MAIKNFDKFAYSYGKYNVIQKEIIKKYIFAIKSRVVDLGCGSEGLCKYKNFDFYLGIDVSENMLTLNPCNTVKLDFNTKKCFEVIKTYDFDQIVSFSALQWADDLDFVFRKIKNLNKDYLLTIFTSNTFKELHEFLGIKSPIYTTEEILKSANILNPAIEILHYEMKFKKPNEVFEYIKFSGVSGGVRAPISKIKQFIKTFPFDTLKFEIIVLKNRN